MLLSRSLENRLLLACARTVPEAREIQELVRLDLDWWEIVKSAEHYGVTPLIYSTLKHMTDSIQVPKEIMEQLKGLSHWHAFHNMNLYRKLKEVLVAFSQEEIPVIVLKGAVLAALVYEDISLRPMKDLDLLVRRQDVDAAHHLLLTLHYVPDESYRSQAWYRDHHHHLAPYIARDRSLVLEIHHHIIRPTVSVRLPIHDLWQRARPAQIVFMTALILAPEDLLLHLCLHLVDDIRSHGMGRPRALCDLAETIRRYKEDIDWDQLLREAQAYEVEKYLYYALWLAQDMVEAEIPAQVLRDLASSMHGQSFEGLSLKLIMRRAVLNHEQVVSPIPAWIIADICAALLSPKGTGKKISTVCKQICQGFVHSAQQIAPQHRFLAPLYTMFIHPFYLLVRAVGRIAHPSR